MGRWSLHRHTCRPLTHHKHGTWTVEVPLAPMGVYPVPVMEAFAMGCAQTRIVTSILSGQGVGVCCRERTAVAYSVELKALGR